MGLALPAGWQCDILNPGAHGRFLYPDAARTPGDPHTRCLSPHEDPAVAPAAVTGGAPAAPSDAALALHEQMNNWGPCKASIPRGKGQPSAHGRGVIVDAMCRKQHGAKPRAAISG